jgi:cholest-4-en-3-one 26-monooxygenase
MTSTVELTAPEIPDLSDPRSFADDVPHAAFAAIRRLPGLYWQPTPVATVNGGFWAVTRFADIQAVEKAPEIFTSTRGAAYPLTQREPNAGPGISLIETDPPQHTRLRRAAAKGFAPRVVANFEPWIREIVRDVIGNVAGKNEFDYVQEFGRTIPAQVIATVVGVPREDRRQMVEWTLALFAATQLTEGLAQGEGTRGRIALPLGAMAEYAGRLQVVKREHPADDMATALTACVDRGEIDQTEFLGWMTIMMGAGFEKTHTAISQAMRMYIENPEVR